MKRSCIKVSFVISPSTKVLPDTMI